MRCCVELCFRKKAQAKEIGNSAMHLFICRSESTPEELLCFNAYKIPYTETVWSLSYSQWKNMFVTQKRYKSHKLLPLFLVSQRLTDPEWILSRPVLKQVKTAETKPVFLYIGKLKLWAYKFGTFYVGTLKRHTNGKKMWF